MLTESNQRGETWRKGSQEKQDGAHSKWIHSQYPLLLKQLELAFHGTEWENHAQSGAQGFSPTEV